MRCNAAEERTLGLVWPQGAQLTKQPFAHNLASWLLLHILSTAVVHVVLANCVLQA